MWIIVDNKIPFRAKEKLENYGELIELETSGITYPAISGHPDIFFTQTPDQLIVAPNLPPKYFQLLENQNINFIIGQEPVGKKYPETARYNAVVTNNHFIHNCKITDRVITDISSRQNILNVNQGYARCNLIFLDEQHAITSDQGIKRELENTKVETLFCEPEGITLPGFDHGFIGGCCGVNKKRLFVLGSLKRYPDEEKLSLFTKQLGFEIIELCDTPLFDGGGIFFVD